MLGSWWARAAVAALPALLAAGPTARRQGTTLVRQLVTLLLRQVPVQADRASWTGPASGA